VLRLFPMYYRPGSVKLFRAKCVNGLVFPRHSPMMMGNTNSPAG
jgi:hypothetical protein